MVETTKHDSMSARRKSKVKKILCLNVSGIREDWDCDTFDLLMIVVRLDTSLPVVKSSRSTGLNVGSTLTNRLIYLRVGEAFGLGVDAVHQRAAPA
jgi:hypothetical protein